MSLSVPPTQTSPPLPRKAEPLTLKARLIREGRHWAGLPAVRLLLLVLPICLLIFFSPLLPCAAYVLWLWASSSWAWRDRWASVWALTWRGGTFVIIVLLIAALGSARIWFFSSLIAALQAFWRTHLPGALSLTPVFDPFLLSRTLLLLPLAPALALYFETIDPRTRVQPRRILTARDLAQRPPKEEPDERPTTQKTRPPQPKAQPKVRPKAGAKAAPSQSAHRRRERSAPPEPITIDSSLASTRSRGSARHTPSTSPPDNKPPTGTTEIPSPMKAPPAPIDWNDVAE